MPKIFASCKITITTIADLGAIRSDDFTPNVELAARDPTCAVDASDAKDVLRTAFQLGDRVMRGFRRIRSRRETPVGAQRRDDLLLDETLATRALE